MLNKISKLIRNKEKDGREFDSSSGNAQKHFLANTLALAAQHHKAGNLQLAEQLYCQILQKNQGSADALHLLGVVCCQTERYDLAVELIKEALKLNPFASNYHGNLANALYELGNLEEAAQFYEKALHLEPDNIDALNGLGMVLNAQGKPDAAIVHFLKVLRLKPDFAEAHNNLGIAFHYKGNLCASVQNLEKALCLNPGYAEAHNNLGMVLWDQGRYDEAIGRHQEALRLKPDFAEAYKDMAEKFWSLGEIEIARKCYRKALRLKPLDAWRIRSATILPPIYSSLDEVARYRDQITKNIDRLSEDGLNIGDQLEYIGTNFYLAYQGKNDIKIQRKLARLFRSAHIPTCEISRNKTNNKRIKVGFISTFFKDYHTIGKLNRGIISGLSRDEFEVSIFSIGKKSDGDIKDIRQAADSYFELPEKLPIIREKILQQNPDILFFTDIGMNPATYIVAFSRLAPVQCVTWGHPVTTGIDTIDYFISTEDLETSESNLHYTEKLIRLKSSPTYYYRPDLPLPMRDRAYFGLPADMHIYLCPQSLFKFHPEFDRTLDEILRRDKMGRLVLISGKYPTWNDLLHKRFRNSMPDILDRISFLPRQGYSDFLNLIAISDVMLDTFFFGGGNTTYEGLYMGTPIVTLPSEFLRGRITYAIYKKMGIMDCVASGPGQYIDIALLLGTDKEFREKVKAKILARNHLLYEDHGVVRELERFFKWAVEKTRSEVEPSSAGPQKW